MHTEELGKVCTQCYVLSGILQNQCIDMGMFMASSMKAAIHLGQDFLKNSEIYKNTRFENIENVSNIIQKLIKEHFEEILNVRSLDFSSPSWTRPTLINDKAIKCAKAKALVSTQIPLYVLVGWIKYREPQKQDGQDILKV